MNKHAQALGRKGGKARSKAKKAASRKNGKKGGRPNMLKFLDEKALKKALR